MPLPANVQNALSALLNQPGETGHEVRGNVLDYARSGSGPVPDGVRDLVHKIANCPWTVNDEDFTRLLAAGYSEGQLYEVTMAAALGAGLARLDAGLRAIDEAQAVTKAEGR